MFAELISVMATNVWVDVGLAAIVIIVGFAFYCALQWDNYDD